MNGFVLVDKPGGWTSHDVVAKLRGMLRERKVGHAGTLDPMATGLLVVGVGRVTRLLRFLQDLPKEYEATMMMGVATDTLDADGAVLSREPMPVAESAVSDAMTRFEGLIHQVPPMVSAIKVGGRRLHELAREGKEVHREPRPVTIHGLDLIDFAPCDYPEVSFRVRCSKGTYVRTLADDIARSLGGHAHLTALRRTAIGSLRVDDALTVEELQRRVDDAVAGTAVISAAQALEDFPHFAIDASQLAGVRNGVPVALTVESVERDVVVRMLDGEELVAMYRSKGSHLVPEVVLS